MIEVSLLENRDRTELRRRRALDWALFELFQSQPNPPGDNKDC